MWPQCKSNIFLEFESTEQVHIQSLLGNITFISWLVRKVFKILEIIVHMRPIQDAHILNNYRNKDTILMRRFSLTNCDKI